MKQAKTATLSIRLTPETLDRLTKAGEATDRSVTGMARYLIIEGLAQRAKNGAQETEREGAKQ